MVDIPRWSSCEGRVDDVLAVQTEHVRVAILRFVQLLLPVCDLVADDSPDVLNHHGVLLKVFSGVEPQPLYGRASQVHVALPLALQPSVLGRL